MWRGAVGGKARLAHYTWETDRTGRKGACGNVSYGSRPEIYWKTDVSVIQASVAQRCSMSRIEKDEVREYRIDMEVVVDAYDEVERTLGWYYYLDEKLRFPFLAKCKTKRAISPLMVGDEVEVVGMPSEEECEHAMFVTIRWEKEGLAVPLSQLESIDADEQTREAVDDWNYWVDRGYQF